MTPAAILETVNGLGLTLTATGERLHIRGDAEPPPDLLTAIKQNKAALVRLLASMPTFNPEQERGLAGYYASRPRDERLTMHKRGLALRRDKGWPLYAAELEAIRETYDAAGRPAGPFELATDGLNDRRAP